MLIKTLKNKAILIIAGLTVALNLVIVASTVVEAADLQNNVCGGASLNLDPSGDCDTTKGPENSLTSLIAKIIEVLSVIVGIAAVIMIIWGGFKFITSGGDAGRLTSAKQTILYALIGLVIVALAQFIVRFVLGKTAEV
jgi:hypothetical protein